MILGLNAFLKEPSQKARELFITLKKGYKTLDAVLKDQKQGATAFQCRLQNSLTSKPTKGDRCIQRSPSQFYEILGL